MSESMNAQVFYEAEKMDLEKLTIPKVTDTDVLVKVKNVGICGSDLSYYFGMSPVGTPTGKGPLVLGHEFTGEVVEVGSVPKALGLFKPGDRVVVNPVQFCNACPDCASGNTHMCQHGSVPGVTTNGAFAEYCVSKYTGLFKLPDEISFAAGACIEPLACAVNGLNKLDIRPGQFVAVFGPGPIGIWMAELAKKAYGAGKVALVGTRDYRLEAGKKAGADYIFNDKEKGSRYYVPDLKKAFLDATDGRLVDRLITPAGPDEALETAVECGGNCSIIVQFGLPDGGGAFKIPSLSFHTMDKQIRSAWLAPGVWPQTIRLVQGKQVSIEPLITHTASLRDLGQALVDLRSRKGNPIKYEIIL
jgi:L-iditol 2-dehydrogenase